MPIYEYECAKGHVVEVMQAITDEKLKRCTKPGCDAPAKRLISGGGGFQLSGSGWAKDGYK